QGALTQEYQQQTSAIRGLSGVKTKTKLSTGLRAPSDRNFLSSFLHGAPICGLTPGATRPPGNYSDCRSTLITRNTSVRLNDIFLCGPAIEVLTTLRTLIKCDDVHNNCLR